jgi:hypothetical protein
MNLIRRLWRARREYRGSERRRVILHGDRTGTSPCGCATYQLPRDLCTYHILCSAHSTGACPD